MSRKFKRTGGPVDVPALGLVDVSTGSTVEAPPEVADGLDGQGGWEHIPDPKRVRAGKKAAKTASTPESAPMIERPVLPAPGFHRPTTEES